MSEAAARPRVAVIASALAFVVAPAVVLWLIVRYGVNTIVWDQIEIGRFLVRNHGRVFPAIDDLFAQHNESRKFFPRIVFFYLARATNWNVKWEMFISFLMACGIAWNLGVIARRAIADHTRALMATAVCALLVFSPVQWWNWLFGIQIVVFAPVLMLTTALLVMGSRLSLVFKFVITVLLCIVATFSYANGMLLWGVLLLPWSAAARRRFVIPLWIATTAAVVALYFHDYHKPQGHPALASPLSAPLHFLEYMLAFLGHPLAWARSVPVATLVGAVLLIVFGVLAVFAIRLRVTEAIAPATIGLYAIASAGATAIGRLGLSLPQALEPRYTTFSVYLPVAVVLLAFIVMPLIRSAPHAENAVLATFVLAHVLAVIAVWPEMILNYRERLLARTAIQFALVSPDRAALGEFVWPYTQDAVNVIGDLSKIGYVHPAPVHSDLIVPFKTAEAFGALERVVPLKGELAGIYGWAALPGPRVADAVLVTRSAPDGEHLIAISRRTALDHPAMEHAGWFAQVPAASMSAGTTVRAWSWDGETMTAYPLAGGIKAQ